MVGDWLPLTSEPDAKMLPHLITARVNRHCIVIIGCTKLLQSSLCINARVFNGSEYISDRDWINSRWKSLLQPEQQIPEHR